MCIYFVFFIHCLLINMNVDSIYQVFLLFSKLLIFEEELYKDLIYSTIQVIIFTLYFDSICIVSLLNCRLSQGLLNSFIFPHQQLLIFLYLFYCICNSHFTCSKSYHYDLLCSREHRLNKHLFQFSELHCTSYICFFRVANECCTLPVTFTSVRMHGLYYVVFYF